MRCGSTYVVAPHLFIYIFFRDAIVNYVNMKMSRSVRALMSVSDIESLLEVKSPMAIAYLKKLKVLLTPSQLCASVITLILYMLCRQWHCDDTNLR